MGNTPSKKTRETDDTSQWFVTSRHRTCMLGSILLLESEDTSPMGFGRDETLVNARRAARTTRARSPVGLDGAARRARTRRYLCRTDATRARVLQVHAKRH